MSRILPDGAKVIGYPTRKNSSSRRKRFNPSKSKLPVVLLVILLAYVVFSFGARFNTLYAMQQDVRQMQEQVDELAEKNARLKDELEMVKTDAYVEEMARENLGLVREGEVQVVPVKPDSDD